jgi:low temperature requirement protein LtrA
MTTSGRKRIQAVGEEARVTPLELFFDLVFVYALTQVTTLMAKDLSGRRVLEGMIVLALIWWCWVGYSWLGNVARADEGWTRGAFIGVMATMFVAALAIPEAFLDLPGGLSGPLVVAVCYAIVRCVHLGMFAIAGRAVRDPGLIHQLVRFGVVMALSIVLIVAGAIVGGDAELVLWLCAVAVDYVGTQAIGASGWRLHSPAHFAERHGLIIIIALGESIVAIGVGVTERPISTAIIVGAVLGIALVAAMWWPYFDVTALAGERAFARRQGVERNRIARDAYSYLHLPMVAGIVIAALGLKKALGYIAGEDGHDWSDSLHGIALASLHAGPALYLLALVAFRYRNVRSLGRSRLVAAAVLLVTIPLGGQIGALGALGLVTAIMASLIAFEAVRYAEDRHRIRHLDGHAPTADEEPVVAD